MTEQRDSSLPGFKLSPHPAGEREHLLPILRESFTGAYLWHARKALRAVPIVHSVAVEGKIQGLVMLSRPVPEIGLVYYIAVARGARRRGLGGALLDASLRFFGDMGVREVVASIERENTPSLGLFLSRHFVKTGIRELARIHGLLKTLRILARMLVVPHEVVMRRVLLADSRPFSTLQEAKGAMYRSMKI